MRYKIYPPELRSTNLDFDWFYRVPLKWLALYTGRLILIVWNWILGIANNIVYSVINTTANTHGNGKILARTTASSTAVMIIVAVLGFVVVFFYRFLQQPVPM